MAIFRIANHVLKDPPTLGALQRAFSNMEEFTPYEDNLYKWYRVEGLVNGVQLPAGNVEIDLNFILEGPNKARVTWETKHNPAKVLK